MRDGASQDIVPELVHKAQLVVAVPGIAADITREIDCLLQTGRRGDTLSACSCPDQHGTVLEDRPNLDRLHDRARRAIAVRTARGASAERSSG
jgi:hypothetical protein